SFQACVRYTVAFLDGDYVLPPTQPGHYHTRCHSDLAASVQHRTEEVLLEVLRWLYEQTGQRRLAMAGGVALNCVANSRIVREGPFERSEERRVGREGKWG